MLFTWGSTLTFASAGCRQWLPTLYNLIFGVCSSVYVSMYLLTKIHKSESFNASCNPMGDDWLQPSRHLLLMRFDEEDTPSLCFLLRRAKSPSSPFSPLSLHSPFPRTTHLSSPPRSSLRPDPGCCSLSCYILLARGSKLAVACVYLSS